MIFEAVVALVAVVVVYILVNYCMHLWQLKQYPPGPWPLPVIGNLHLIISNPHKALKRLTKKYGPVMGFSFGNQRLVVVQGIEEAREMLINKGEDFAGRPQNNYSISVITSGYKDIAASDYNTTLKAKRKIALRALKAHGDGLDKLEKILLNEVEAIFQRFDAKSEEAFDPRHDLNIYVTNVICRIISSKGYSSKYKERFEIEVLEFLQTLAKVDFTSIVNFVKFFRLFPNNSLTELKRASLIRDQILDKILKEHRETYDPENLRDFTDIVLSELDREEKDGYMARKRIDDENLRQIFSDLFFAGSETTTSVLTWCFAYLAACPDVQRQIAKEREKVIGDRMPRWSDKGSLDYFEAVIQEALRMGSVVPLAVPRKTIHSTECGGHKIPAGTQVWYNMWSIHHDQKQWDEPFSFKPERFIDGNGKLIRATYQSFLPFGGGKRRCIGESVARMEIFILLSNVLYRYDIVADGGAPDLEGEFGTVLKPKPFRIKVKHHNSCNLSNIS